MKKKLFSFAVIVMVMGSLFALNTMHRANAVELLVDKNIDQIMANIDKLILENPNLASNSNPYAYITDNKEFDNIVNLGVKALPVIKNNIDKSSENGLREYILGIAGEKIAKVDLKGDNFGWSNAKEWSKVWDIHLKNVKSETNKIVNSNMSDSEKVSNIVKLGIPALPYVSDYVGQGKTELIPALQQLAEDTNYETSDLTKLDANNAKNWIENNNGKFDDIRSLVEGAN